jgi:hypothetical protein
MPKKKAKLVELEQKIDVARRIVAKQQAIRINYWPLESPLLRPKESCEPTKAPSITLRLIAWKCDRMLRRRRARAENIHADPLASRCPLLGSKRKSP